MDKLICSVCKVKVSELDFKMIFAGNQTAIAKYYRFINKADLEKDELVRWCPRLGCEGFGQAPNNLVRLVECLRCKGLICFECREAEHSGTCEENTKQLYAKIFKGANIDLGFCPKCKTKVEKIEGCNHMTCYICKFQWCWLCGGTYSS